MHEGLLLWPAMTRSGMIRPDTRRWVVLGETMTAARKLRAALPIYSSDSAI